MLYKHFTEELLGLQGLIIEEVKNTDNKITIFAVKERTEQYCPCCGTATRTIHDYRTQIIKDIPAFGKAVEIYLRKRRYRCNHCQKRFAEENTFLPKYHRITSRLSAFVIHKLANECSFTSVAREVFLSVTTVTRIFDRVSYPKIINLPKVLAIDEFKGNTWGEKYQCILTNPATGEVLDILPKRYEYYLTTYFKRFSYEERKQVKYFVSDMWKPYSELASTWFKDAVKIVDKYHWIRQVIWAFERIRKIEQKKFGKDYRIYFKNSRNLLLKRFNFLNDEQKQQVNVMLYSSVNLSRAHWYKEKFLEILDCRNKAEAKLAMKKWIEDAEESGLPDMEKCAKTIRNWYSGILNSFSVPYTNGFTEGCNNKIKVLKRNAYGYKNFNRFRNRILHMFLYHYHQKKAATSL